MKKHRTTIIAIAILVIIFLIWYFTKGKTESSFTRGVNKSTRGTVSGPAARFNCVGMNNEAGNRCDRTSCTCGYENGVCPERCRKTQYLCCTTKGVSELKGMLNQ